LQASGQASEGGTAHDAQNDKGARIADKAGRVPTRKSQNYERGRKNYWTNGKGVHIQVRNSSVNDVRLGYT